MADQDGAGFPPAGPGFEAAVLGAVRSEIDRYCQRVPAAKGVDPQTMEIDITVATVHELRAVRDQIRYEARRFIRNELRHERVEVSFDIHRDLPRAGYQIDIQPILDWAGGGDGPVRRPDRAADRTTESMSSGDPLDRWTVLPGPGETSDCLEFTQCLEFTLCYGDDEWVYSIFPVDRWVPVGRLVETYPIVGAIRLPDSAAFLPRGALVGIWYQPGELWLRRSRLRAEYTVLADGRVVRPGGDVELNKSGSIEFARAGRDSTVLGYRTTLRRG